MTSKNGNVVPEIPSTSRYNTLATTGRTERSLPGIRERVNGSRPGPLMVAISVLEGDRLRAPRCCQTTRSVSQINSFLSEVSTGETYPALYREYQLIILWLVSSFVPSSVPALYHHPQAITHYTYVGVPASGGRRPSAVKSSIFFHLGIGETRPSRC